LLSNKWPDEKVLVAGIGRIGSKPGDANMAMLDARTIVVGDEKSVIAAIDIKFERGAEPKFLLIVHGKFDADKLFSDSLGWLVAVVVLSGTYIAVEETLEKAVAAEMLPRELRSLGFGILACANAVGDMASSLYVGYLLESHQPAWAFGIAAAIGAVGVLWLWLMGKRFWERTISLGPS